MDIEKTLTAMTPEERCVASEGLITDLYIDLRNKVNKWARLTHQTSQARMGYIGQHLVSIATGLEGSKTGARGDDLVYPDGRHSEVKTCYRVDQLGECSKCHSKVATMDKTCPSCGSSELIRKDDSKWLISIPATEFAEKEFGDLFRNELFYLVLFEFEDLQNPETIIASIWSVDPLNRGFAYCMLDYYKNIWPCSKSHAAFNLWPYSFKFELMQPQLVYRAKIESDDSIHTIIFPQLQEAVPNKLSPLTTIPSRSIEASAVQREAVAIGVKIPSGMTSKETLKMLQTERERKNISDEVLIPVLQRAMYYDKIQAHLSALPEEAR